MVNIGSNRASSFIIESKLYTQNKFSEKWGKTKEISLRNPSIYIYLSLPEP
jgi:hypothetical protein